MGRTQVDGHSRKLKGKTVYVRPHTRDLKEGPYSKTTHPIPTARGEVWLFGLQEHHAKKSGKHFDLRLGDPSGKAHSWHSLKGKDFTLPPPGKSTLVMQTFTHKNDYMPFEGRLETGYGQGKVFLKQYSHAIIHSSDEKKVVFSVTRGKSTEDFALLHIGKKNWILVNMTAPKKETPRGRPKYKEIGWKTPQRDEIVNRDDVIVGAKLDGAHALVLMRPGKRIRAFSTRESKTGDLLEYTHKIKDLYATKAKGGKGPTILRGEVLAIGPDGVPLPPEKVGGMLNATVINSLHIQAEAKAKTKIFLFDAVKINGHDVTKLPYKERLQLLHTISAKYPVLGVAPVATSPKDKSKLLDSIGSGKHPLTREGVVLWTDKGPVKSKLRYEHDVYVREIFPGGGKYAGKAAGGFSYSLTRHGPIVGKVGTGLNDALREDLWQNKKRYVGLVARVTAEKQYESGALSKASFSDWHVEKNIK